MTQPDFKIIVDGKELSYPMLRIATVMIMCWLLGLLPLIFVNYVN